MSLKLFDYQLKAVEMARQAMREHKSVMLYAPTGSGKTEIAIHLLNSAKLKSKRSAMVLDRIVLCDQTSERLDRYKIEHGVQQAGHWRNRKYEPIQVCSAQTLEKKNEFPDLSLLIVDEAHQTRKKTAEFIKNASVKVIGLSASPFTKGLGSIYTQVINVTTYQHLIENVKQLVPLKVFVAKEINMDGAKVVAGEWSSQEVETRSLTIVGDVVQEWIDTTNKVFGKQVKSIVFASGVAHGQELVRRFAEKGFNFISVSYLDEDDYKREVIAEFSKLDTEIHGLIATDILTKGFDCPSVLCGVSARPFRKSFSSHVQQMGRVMRSLPGKEFGLWIDFSGNYLRFQESWDDLYYNGVTELDDGKEKPPKEKTKEEKEERTCPSCKALWAGGDTCSHCGYRKERKNTVEEVAGEVVELKEKSVLKMNKADYMGYCKWMEKHQGWSEKRTAASYKGYYDVWPRGLSMIEPKQPTAEFFEATEAQMKKYLTKQRRAGYAKAKEKLNGKTA